MKLKQYILSLLLSFICLTLVAQTTEADYKAFKKDLEVASKLVSFGVKKQSAMPLLAASEILLKHSFAIESKSESLNPGLILDKALRFAKIQGTESLLNTVKKMQAQYNDIVNPKVEAETETATPGDPEKLNANKFYHQRFILKPGKKHTFDKSFLGNTNAEVRVMISDETASVEIKVYQGKEEVSDVTAIDECNETGVEWTPKKELEFKIEITNTSEVEAECLLFTN